MVLFKSHSLPVKNEPDAYMLRLKGRDVASVLKPLSRGRLETFQLLASVLTPEASVSDKKPRAQRSILRKCLIQKPAKLSQ